MEDIIRLFVGVDRSQMLAFKVLEYSIRQNTQANIEITPMLDLPIRLPKDPANYPRTGFSFTRFCIPELAGFKGKAIYTDADMQVFRDIKELWEIPFDGAHIIIQDSQLAYSGPGRKKVKRQCSVMLLDCDHLRWKIDEIITDLDDGKYTYGELMSGLCIVDDDKVSTRLPDYWNHLDKFTPETRLTHYTKMSTQPWLSSVHPLAEVWLSAVREMLDKNIITYDEIQHDIDAGYLRPSLMKDIKYGHKLSSWVRPLHNAYNFIADYLKGFRPHQVLYKLLKEARQNAADVGEGQTLLVPKVK